jgi:hypothetical protein
MKKALPILRSRFSVLRSSFFLLAAAGAWFIPASGGGGPLKGPHAMSKVHVLAKGQTEFEEVFQGGRRACVIAVGDHKPVVDIGISVYDAAKRLVAEDNGGGDYVAAIWYPPRDAKYKIVVKNDGVEYNEMYIVFK